MLISLSKDTSRLTSGTDPWFVENPPYDAVNLAESMLQFLKDSATLGISYPQLNLNGNFSVFAIRGMQQNYWIANPKIVDVSKELLTLDEACLSFPGLIVPVTRPRHIRARFTAPDGQVYTEIFRDFDARTFQHELDHVEGRLFWSSVSKLKFYIAVRKAEKEGHDCSKFVYKGIVDDNG